MSQIKVNSIVPVGGLASGVSGGIIQVVNAIKTDTTSTSSSFADTGLSASITPTSTSSKILILAMLGGVGADNSSFKAKLMRGSTDVAVGDSASNRARATVQGQFSNTFNGDSFHMHALDSPSTTSATTYKVQFGGNGGVTVFLNRIARDTDGSAEDARTASTLTLLEVTG